MPAGQPHKVVIEYFALGEARSSALQFLCHHAGIVYEFKGHSFESWGAEKAAGRGGEFGGLPRVHIDKHELGESQAILRCMGAKHGYYNPNDPKQSYLVDVVLDCFGDLHDTSNGVALGVVTGQMTAEDGNKAIAEKIPKVFEPILNLYEAQLGHGCKFIAGEKVTIADCAMVALMANILENPNGPFFETYKPLMTKYPKISAYFGRLRIEFAKRLNDPNRAKAPV